MFVPFPQGKPPAPQCCRPRALLRSPPAILPAETWVAPCPADQGGGSGVGYEGLVVEAQFSLPPAQFSFHTTSHSPTSLAAGVWVVFTLGIINMLYSMLTTSRIGPWLSSCYTVNLQSTFFFLLTSIGFSESSQPISQKSVFNKNDLLLNWNTFSGAFACSRN